MLYHLSRFELKSLSDTGEFSGYGSTFGNVDYALDVCVKGCFRDTIEEHKQSGILPAMCYQHNEYEPVGDWLEWREDEMGLFMKGRLWLDIERGKQAHRMLQSKTAKGLSIGYRARKYRIDESSGIRYLEEVEVGEVSPVQFPANPFAKITAVKSVIASGRDFAEAESALRALGVSPEELAEYKSRLSPKDSTLRGLLDVLKETTHTLKG